MRRLAFAGLNHVPNLSEFVKFARTVGDEDFDTPREPVKALPNPDRWTGDVWDEAANHHLLAYIVRRQRAWFLYCDPETAAARRPAWQPTQEARDLMAPILAYKHAWARDMREAAVDHKTGEDVGADPKWQRECWADCMQRAELMVDEVRKRYAAQRAGKAA